ncbi:MAG: hypothetical protein WBB07_12110 [Mycobacterium sp.]
MKALLELFVKHFEFLYSNSANRITNSKASGANAINASLTVTGPELSWLIVNDRGQMQLSLAPTRLLSSDNWFWVSLIRQYVDALDEIQYLPATGELNWVRANEQRVADLFSDPSTIENVCAELRALRRANAEKYWGPAATGGSTPDSVVPPR